MRDVDELRQTLSDHENLAPDAAGLVETAQQGATRIRRRRRAAYAACVAVAVASGVAFGPTAVGHLDRATTQGGSGAYRGPLQLTVDLAPDSGYVKGSYGVIGSTQVLLARPSSNSPDRDATIVVHDPGSYDPALLQRGERITILGHSGFFVPDLPLGNDLNADMKTLRQIIGPAVGWRDASGAWVVVHSGKGKAELLAVADAVRLGAPRDIRAPYQLTYVPDDLPGTFAMTSDHRLDQMSSVIDLGGRPSFEGVSPPLAMSGELPLEIHVLPRSVHVDRDTPDRGALPTKIAGHDSWYFTEPGVRVFPPGGSAMIVDVGHCQVNITTKNRKQIPYEELKRLVEGAKFKDCTDPRTWVPPLP